MKKNQKLVNLIQSIEGLLSESRCPLTNEDRVLLRNCLKELKELRDLDENPTDLLEITEKVIKWILLFFNVYDKLKAVF